MKVDGYQEANHILESWHVFWTSVVQADQNSELIVLQ